MKSIKYLLLALSCFLLLQCKKSTPDILPPQVITGIYFPDISIVKGEITKHSEYMTTYGHVWDTIPAPEVDGSPKSEYSYQGDNGDTLEVISSVDFTEGTTYYIRGYAQDKLGNIFYGSYEIIYDPTNPANNPTACFETNTVQCEVGNCAINFDADCSIPNSTFISSYNWDFDGDGIFDIAGSDKQAVSHTYTTAGTYAAQLEVVTHTGVASDTTINIQVNSSGNTLLACFVVTKDACDIDDCTIDFDASCSVNANNYKWDFDGDGVFNIGGVDKQIVSHTYSTAGTYNVRLEIEGAGGNTKDTTLTIQVYDIQADFTLPGGTIYEDCEVVFMNNSTGATSYLWDFGDGNTSTDENPDHIYSNPGTYTITLTATMGEIEVVSMQNITIYPTVKFENIRNLGAWDNYNAVVLSPDGGYVISGSTSSQGAGLQDVYLTKTDANGNIQWEKTFGGSSYDYATSIVSASDGGYVLAGHTSSQGAGESDVYLIKTDANGNMQWEKTFGEVHIDEVYSIVSAPDGGYVMAGRKQPAPVGVDIYVIKTDSNGNLQWEKTFGGSNTDEAYSITSAPDGGYVIAGYTYSQGAGADDVYMIKIDANGNMLWEETFGGSSFDGAYSIISAFDGGYVLAGYTSSQGAGLIDVYLIKTDSNGNMQWEKTFGGSGSDRAFSVVPSTDGGYVLAGYTSSQGAGLYDVYLIKTDANGNMLWEKTFGNSSNDGAGYIKSTNDCGYIVVGRYNNGSNDDFYLIKTDSEGNTQ